MRSSRNNRLIFRMRRNNNRSTIWTKNRKVMCHKLIKFLFKSNRYMTRKRWIEGLHIFRLQKAFDNVLHKRLLWKLKYIGGLKGTLKNWREH